MKRSIIVAVSAVAVTAGLAGVGLSHVQREREWAHGGDGLAVDVAVAVATDKTFDDVVVRLGAPPGVATRWQEAEQSVVVRVNWSGFALSDGHFELITLDGRVSPPRPLAADGGWNAEGSTGSNWAGAYEALAQRYDWLGGIVQADYTGIDGMTEFPTAAVDARATTSGTATAWFRQWEDGSIPFGDPAREIVVAVVHVDDSGEVRWAKRAFG